MLTELEINNLGPIRKAIIQPSAGMTAITGETGAGKSMLLSALTMLTGGSISSDKVSAGADKSTASGVFDYEYMRNNNADNDELNNVSMKPEPLRLSDEHDIEYETDEQPADNENNDDNINMVNSELILRRIIPIKGRGKCVINDATITRKTMSLIGNSMITIHGQSEQLRVSSASKQLEMLDSYAGNNEALNVYITAYNNRMKLQKQLDEINNPETLQRIDYLKESIKRIKKADLHDGEYDELKQKIDEMENNQTKLENINKALMILDGDDNSMTSMLSILIPILEDLNIGNNHANTNDSMNDDSDNASIIDSVYDMKETISNITNILSKDTDDIEAFNIDEANERIMTISSVIRKFGGSESKALEWMRNAENEIERIDVDEDKIEELQQDLKELIGIENKAADTLTKTRVEAAEMLTEHVNNELKQLAMPNSEFKVNIETSHDDNHVSIAGHDKVSFMFKAYENAPELPIGKSASGGELSRLTLALELTIASKHPDVSNDMTFVFDEVDAGIGGKTGIEIGKRLAELARTSQVIIVTHLAQVAAYADTQYVVSKHVNNDNTTETIISQVNGNDRTIEIARMLSGDDSEISMKHAEQLLINSKV